MRPSSSTSKPTWRCARPACRWKRPACARRSVMVMDLGCLRRVTLPGALLAVALLLPQGVRADDGARLAATCTACHGTDGHTLGDALPPLAGQPIEALLASLRAFKSGERSAT